jgi:hypothetical protein
MNTNIKNIESAYEWLSIPEDIPKENLVLVKAKTTNPTYHPTDPKFKKRTFKPEELKEAARSLAQRPVGKNHQFIIEQAKTIDAQWNESTQSVETLVYMPTPYINWIKTQEALAKEVKWSVEFTFRESTTTPEGDVEFSGIVFNRVDIMMDLPEGYTAGDSLTSCKLLESTSNMDNGFIEGISMSETLKESAKIEELTKTVETLTTEKNNLGKELETIKQETAKIPVLLTEKENLVKERDAIKKEKEDLDKVVTKLQENNKTIVTESETKIATAKKEIKENLMNKIQAVLPNGHIVSNFNHGGKILAEDIRRVLYEVTKET